MNYETTEKILTGKRRGKKTTSRYGHGMVRSQFDLDTDSLYVTSNEDSARNHVMVRSSSHYMGRGETEVAVKVFPRDSGCPAFAIVELKSRETRKGSEMDSLDHDNDITIGRQSTVFLGFDQLAELKAQVDKAVRKAKREGLI